jgi:hypothetical protein
MKLFYANVTEVGLNTRQSILQVIMAADCATSDDWRQPEPQRSEKLHQIAPNATFTAFIRKVSIDGSPFGGGNFSASGVGCVG